MRSRRVTATVIATLVGSALMCGCGNKPTQQARCVDNNNTVMDWAHCDNNSGGHYYYGGFGGSNIGDRVDGGSTAAASGKKVVRGGIGSKNSVSGSGSTTSGSAKGIAGSGKSSGS